MVEIERLVEHLIVPVAQQCFCQCSVSVHKFHWELSILAPQRLIVTQDDGDTFADQGLVMPVAVDAMPSGRDRERSIEIPLKRVRRGQSLVIVVDLLPDEAFVLDLLGGMLTDLPTTTRGLRTEDGVGHWLIPVMAGLQVQIARIRRQGVHQENADPDGMMLMPVTAVDC